MTHLDKEIEFYESKEDQFLLNHKLEWVLISEQKILGFFREFEFAARKLEEEYDPSSPDRPFLLRQIGAPDPVINRMMFASV